MGSFADRLRALDDRVVGEAERAEGPALLRDVLALRARALAVAVAVFTLVELVVGREPLATLLLLGAGAGVGALTGRFLASKQASDLAELPRTPSTAPPGSPVPGRALLVFLAVAAAGVLVVVLLAQSPTPVPALLLALALQAVLHRAGLVAAEREQSLEVLVSAAGSGAVARPAAGPEAGEDPTLPGANR